MSKSTRLSKILFCSYEKGHSLRLLSDKAFHRLRDEMTPTFVFTIMKNSRPKSRIMVRPKWNYPKIPLRYLNSKSLSSMKQSFSTFRRNWRKVLTVVKTISCHTIKPFPDVGQNCPPTFRFCSYEIRSPWIRASTEWTSFWYVVKRYTLRVSHFATPFHIAYKARCFKFCDEEIHIVSIIKGVSWNTIDWYIILRWWLRNQIVSWNATE